MAYHKTPGTFHPWWPFEAQKLEFGNRLHIEWLKGMDEMYSGLRPVCKVDLMPCRIVGNDEQRKPIHKYIDWGKNEAVVFWVPCPNCARLHKQVILLDSEYIGQTQLVQMWNVEEQVGEGSGFACYNCETQFYIESTVRQPYEGADIFIQDPNPTKK